jgi:hypothetical protein
MFVGIAGSSPAMTKVWDGNDEGSGGSDEGSGGNDEGARRMTKAAG